MPAGSTYTPIATTTLGSAANTLTFSSISGSYTDIVAICSVKGTTGTNEVIRAQVNGDTGNNYSYTFLQGSATDGAYSARASNTSLILVQANNNGVPTPSNTFGTFITHFMNYSNTTTNKTILSRGNALGSPGDASGASVSLWRSTAAITSIRFYIAAGNFDTGSTFTLYGIASA